MPYKAVCARRGRGGGSSKRGGVKDEGMAEHKKSAGQKRPCRMEGWMIEWRNVTVVKRI